MPTLKAIQTTYLKPDTRQSSEIPKDKLIPLKPGDVVEIAEWGQEGYGHVWIKQEKTDTQRWFAWRAHVEIAGFPQPASKSVELKVPYLSQLDNENNPTGSCNVTSVAMCLGYFGHPLKNPNTGEQLEDELYRYMLNNGLSRHSPQDLEKLIKQYGYKDDFQPDAKWGEVKEWLAAGKPCVVHGWFTKFGHIIVIIGYNEKGWIVHDPYGEWWDWGYDTAASGKALTYSYGMMKELCGPDGDLWIHYISK